MKQKCCKGKEKTALLTVLFVFSMHFNSNVVSQRHLLDTTRPSGGNTKWSSIFVFIKQLKQQANNGYMY